MQAPEFTQSFNRYSYAFNNPLIYTDPTGEWFFKAIGALFGPVGIGVGMVIDAALWGATISGGMYTIGAAISQGGLSQNWNGNNFWRSVASGAASGAMTGVMGLMSPGFTVSSTSFSENLPVYLQKAAYAGLTASMSTGVGLMTYNAMSEREDWIENIGKKMFTSGLTAGLFSFGMSIFDYQTWDKLSVSEKMAKVQNKFGSNVLYDPAAEKPYYITGETDVYLAPNSLGSKRTAFTSARHELKHLNDWSQYRAGNLLLPAAGAARTNYLEIRAYKHDMRYFRMDINTYKKSFEFIRDNHSYRGPGTILPNPFIYFNSIF